MTSSPALKRQPSVIISSLRAKQMTIIVSTMPSLEITNLKKFTTWSDLADEAMTIPQHSLSSALAPPSMLPIKTPWLQL
jgi:hypothetical protein